jgi:uncharacterized protein
MRMPKHFAALFYVSLAFVPGVALAQGMAPAFDCAKATGEVERLVCSDGALAALDHRMTAVYGKAMKRWPAGEAARQRALQRGWIKGRNDCWKASDTRARSSRDN